jgi:hypothetical protein
VAAPHARPHLQLAALKWIQSWWPDVGGGDADCAQGAKRRRPNAGGGATEDRGVVLVAGEREELRMRHPGRSPFVGCSSHTTENEYAI